jgi:hypothetical protein
MLVSAIAILYGAHLAAAAATPACGADNCLRAVRGNYLPVFQPSGHDFLTL